MKKKTKGRPKKIKEEDEEKTNQPEPNLNSIDPLMKAREDAIERTFHELNEFYNLQSDLAEAQMTFNQVRICHKHVPKMYSTSFARMTTEYSIAKCRTVYSPPW